MVDNINECLDFNMFVSPVLVKKVEEEEMEEQK